MEFYGKAAKAKEEQLINQYKEELNLIILDEIAERKIEDKKELMIESLDKKISQKDWVKEPISKYNKDYEPQNQYEESMYLLVESKDGYEFLIKVDNKNNFAEIVNAGKKAEKPYIVTYSPNGGTGTKEVVEVRPGFAISLKECNYSKEGYKFGGWCEDAGGNQKRYAPKATYKPEKDITLYATWDADLVTINFDSNDGTNQTQKLEVTRGKATQLPKDILQKQGYVLVEWNTKQDGSGTSYQENSSITVTEDSITLYAKWEEDREVPEYWEMTSKTDSEWYDYGNAKILEPKLTGRMRAIKYVGESQTGNKWANAITLDGSMWVWIPRYAYKITKGYHTNQAGTIEVAFLDTNNNFLNGEQAGKPETDPSKITYTNGVQNQWLVHPAFTANATNGGGFGEIEGLWVRKI